MSKISELLSKLEEKKFPGLLNRENSIIFINFLNEMKVRIYGFDGFNVGNQIKTSTNIPIASNKIQPEQDYSRDYSRFSSEESYKLCLEYFLKDKSEGTLYQISFDNKEY